MCVSIALHKCSYKKKKKKKKNREMLLKHRLLDLVGLEELGRGFARLHAARARLALTCLQFVSRDNY